MATVRIDTDAHSILKDYKELLVKQGREGADFSDAIRYLKYKADESERLPTVPAVIESMMSLSELTKLQYKLDKEEYMKVEKYAKDKKIRIFDAIIELTKLGLERV